VLIPVSVGWLLVLAGFQISSWWGIAFAAVAVVGGLATSAAGPLTVLTDDPRFTVLFPFQASIAVWLIGTGVRLLRR
jgi:hypothetical protein